MKELKRDEASLENVCPGLLDFGHVAGCTQSRLHCIPLREVTLAKLDSAPHPADPTPGYFTIKVKERMCCHLVASLAISRTGGKAWQDMISLLITDRAQSKSRLHLRHRKAQCFFTAFLRGRSVRRCCRWALGYLAASSDGF